MQVDGPLPDLLRTYQIMKAFPGITPPMVDEIPALQWDWLLAIDTEVKKAQQQSPK